MLDGQCDAALVLGAEWREGGHVGAFVGCRRHEGSIQIGKVFGDRQHRRTVQFRFGREGFRHIGSCQARGTTRRRLLGLVELLESHSAPNREAAQQHWDHQAPSPDLEPALLEFLWVELVFAPPRCGIQTTVGRPRTATSGLIGVLSSSTRAEPRCHPAVADDVDRAILAEGPRRGSGPFAGQHTIWRQYEAPEGPCIDPRPTLEILLPGQIPEVVERRPVRPVLASNAVVSAAILDLGAALGEGAPRGELIELAFCRVIRQLPTEEVGDVVHRSEVVLLGEGLEPLAASPAAHPHSLSPFGRGEASAPCDTAALGSAPMQRPRPLAPIPAELVFIVAAVSLYVGAGQAVLLFDRLGAVGVAWARTVIAACVLLAWRRPPLGRPREWTTAASFGLVTTGMNTAFYLSADELPLGTAVAVEFLGPVSVAAIGRRSRRNLGALGITMSGVCLMVEAEWTGSAGGVAWALLAATLWGAYILAAERIGRRDRGLDELAVGLGVSAIVFAPVAALTGPGVGAISLPSDLVALTIVGVLSSVVPYGLDQLTMPRLGPARFAHLSAILPTTAVVIAAIVLGQSPGIAEIAGVALVSVGIRFGEREPPPDQEDAIRAAPAM